jgi:hypothetical protein
VSVQPTDNAQLVEDIAGFTHDPLGYALYNFPWGVKGTPLEGRKLRTWQREGLDKLGQALRQCAAEDQWAVIQDAVASGHGIGKTAYVSIIVKWAFDTREDTRGVITANTENQLRTKTWPEVAKWHEMSLTRDWATHTATALISKAPGHDKNWRIDAVPWSESNTEAFAGLHNEGKRILLVFDEASAIGDKVWEVAEGALTDANTEILWLVFGNPTRATGRFRECFRKLKHRWKGRQIDSRTVEDTNKEQIQQWVDDYGEDSDFVKVRVRGIFPSMSAKQFISETDVDAAFGKHLRSDQYDFAAKILTCDPAWEGDDALEIGLRQGLSFKLLRTIPKNDNDVQMANIIANLEDEHGADAVFVDAGYGTGIVSAGQTMGRAWMLVWFSGESSDPGCLNKRAEMWKLGRDWLKAGGAIPANQELRDDLIGPETVARLDGKIQLESKKDMKKRGLPSPNKGDCLMLSFAFPVAPRGKGHQATKSMNQDYDPYARLG